MNFLYLPKLIINNIDSVIISLLTGIVTSIFVSRIFLIKQNEDEKMRRIKPRIEVLFRMMGGIEFIVDHYEELIEDKHNDLIYYWCEENSDTLKEESRQFNYMDFEDLDQTLKSIAVEHNNLIEEMLGCVHDPNKISVDILKKWSNELKSIMNNYKNYYKKKSIIVLYKNVLLDKFVISIAIIIGVLLLIA